MKKLLVLVLALALLLVTSASALTVAPAGTYPIVDEPVTLKVLAMMRSNYEDLPNNEMTKRFEALTNVHIEWEWVTGQDAIATKFATSVASGDYPDIYWGFALEPSQIMLYANQGVFVAIDDMIDDCMPNFAAMLEADPTIKTAITAPDGHIYSLARTDAGLHMITPNKLYINTDWLEMAGMEMPETTEEFEEYLVYVRDHDMNGDGDTTDEIPMAGSAEDCGGFTMLPTSWLLSSWELQPATRLNVGEGGQLYFSAATDAYKEGLKWVKHLCDEGLYAKDSFTMNLSQLTSLTSDPEHLNVGASVGFVGTVFFGFKGLDADTSAHMRDIYASVLPVASETGRRLTTGYDTNCELNTFVSSACENVEVALKWMDYWFSTEGTIESMYGWENEQYEWVNEPAINGDPVSLKPYVLDADDPNKVGNATWNGAAARYDTQYTRYCETANPKSGSFDYYRDSVGYLDFFPETWLPQTIWFTNEQASELGLIDAILMDYVAQAEAEFITGKRDIDADWDAYLAELEGIGLENYIAIYQEAYDTILANK